jgi:lipopolysaccharide transport system ATP-binding protein
MISLRVEDLGKAYRLYAKPVDSLKELLLRRPFHETFWALKGVDFTLGRSGSLGVVGENGAGKTTLLQLLAGTMKATSGRLERHGRVSAILELGSGFHPDLSGEDNVRIGCAVLGLSPAETERRLPAIVAFSELEDFIDRPVKTYSSGMYVRLAFSVATSVDPDILVVDEALSVGDQHFQKKCMDRMNEFRWQGNAMVFCSHSLYFVRQVTEQCLWLKNGRPVMLGPTIEVTERYQDYVRTRDGNAKEEPAGEDAARSDVSQGESYLSEVVLDGECHDDIVETGGTLVLRIVASLEAKARGDAHVGLKIERNDGVWCDGSSTEMDRGALHPLGGAKYGVNFVVDDLPLLAGEYSIDVFLIDGAGVHTYDMRKAAVNFRVRQGTKELGMTRIPHRWERP